MSVERALCGLLAACVVAAAAPDRAGAQAKYRVKIASTPGGATVYLNSRNTEPLGKTPLSVRLPAGNHAVIVELTDHEQLVDSIYVQKQRWRVQSFQLKLKEIEYGFVAVSAENDDARGADILIDGKKSGIVPRTIKLTPGAHQIEVVKRGFTRFEKWIEIGANDKSEMAVTLRASGDTTPPPAEPVIETKKPATAAPRGGGVLLAATAGVELGWRKLRYRNPRTTNLRPFDADNVGMLNVRARLYPLAKSGNPHLRRAAFIGEVALAAPVETNTMGGAEAIETNWRELDVGVRYAVRVSPSVSAAVDLAYGATQFSFTNAGALMDSVPEVDYRYVRVAGELIVRSGPIRAALSGAWLPILSTGVMAERFGGVASAGLKINASASHDLTRNLAAAASVFYRRYAHNFAYGSGDAYQADGAEDHFFGLTLGLTLRAF